MARRRRRSQQRRKESYGAPEPSVTMLRGGLTHVYPTVNALLHLLRLQMHHSHCTPHQIKGRPQTQACQPDHCCLCCPAAAVDVCGMVRACKREG